MTHATEIFTKTVDYYTQYRPSYPEEVIQLLINKKILLKNAVIADLGAGTGIFTKLLLERGGLVYAVEPNQAMRTAAELELICYPNFKSVAATAEATTLPEQSIDLITVATAFHWMDANQAKLEFQRILKPSGYVALLWNVRDQEHSVLQQDYESLIKKYGHNYKERHEDKFDVAKLENFFSPSIMHSAVFPYAQHFDWEGLKGRLLSTSYAPQPHEANFNIMLEELRAIYDQYQDQNKVEFLYRTMMYYGQL